MYRRFGLVSMLAVAVAVAVGAAGCQAGDDKQGADKQGSTGGSGGSGTFDLYLSDKVDFIRYATRELNNNCMAKAGFPQMKQAGNGIYSSKSMLEVDRKRFRGFASEAEAREIGFGRGQAKEPPSLISNDPSFDAALAACEKAAQDKLGPDSNSTLTTYSELANQLSGELGVWVRKELPKAMEPMLDCLGTKNYKVSDRAAYLKNPYDMKPFGLPQGRLDGTPYDWQPKKIPGTVEVGPAKPELRYIPSSQESDFAATWYQCDQSTGRLQKLLDGAHKVEAAAVAKHEEKLAELNPKIEAIAKQAAALVGPAPA